MHPQLRRIADDLESAADRLRALHRALPGHAWNDRPAPSRWSAAECVAHLNLSSAALLPRLHAGLQEARRGSPRPGARYRRDPIGWVIWQVVSPSGGLKTATRPEFVPTGEPPLESLMREFDRLQADVLACVQQADGLPIDAVKLVSPFDGRVRYSVYSALTLVPRHQHRHLHQAERAARVRVPLASALPV
jgi:DinB superfamily